MAVHDHEVPAQGKADVIQPEVDARRVLWFEEVGSGDTHLVGGKAASLGEMYRQLVPQGVRVPNGFATTTRAHREFVAAAVPKGCWDSVDVDDQLQNLKLRATNSSTLAEARLRVVFEDAPADDQLEMHGRTALARSLVLAAPIPQPILDDLQAAYSELSREFDCEVDAAVRSSAVAEDSDAASVRRAVRVLPQHPRSRGHRRRLEGVRGQRLHRTRRELPARAGDGPPRGRARRGRDEDGPFRHRQLRRHLHPRPGLGQPQRHPRQFGLRSRRDGGAGHGFSRHLHALERGAPARPAVGGSPLPGRQGPQARLLDAGWDID